MPEGNKELDSGAPIGHQKVDVDGLKTSDTEAHAAKVMDNTSDDGSDTEHSM
jgi:hypothetical protein